MEILLRIILAVVLGGLIGLEREYTQKSAGLRTHILVTLGATLFTMVSMADFVAGASILNDPSFNITAAKDIHIQFNRDPARIAAQIVTGIGFIGGGAVLRHGPTVRGLTTAADLWAMASIGMLIGVGHYLTAVVATCVIFLVLFTVGALERNFLSKNLKGLNRIRLDISVESPGLQGVQDWLEAKYGDFIMETKTTAQGKKQSVDLTYIMNVGSKKIDISELSQLLTTLVGVQHSSVKAYHDTDDAG